MRKVGTALVTLMVALTLAAPAASARGSSGGHSSPSYSGSRSSSYSGTRSGTSTKAPTYSGARSGTNRSTSKAPTYSGAKVTGSVTHTGSGPSSIPRSVRTTSVVILPSHPAYGTLYHGRYYYHGVYYPYYYDGSYYSYDPAGYRVPSGGIGAGAVVGIILGSLLLLGLLAFLFLGRRPSKLH